MVEKTLQEMRLGGIYDHVGYGFHRYSTDPKWLVPHFEKMLYDQALLAIAYTEAYQATKNELYKTTVKEILEYVSRDMLSKKGGFYSAEDADSEGEEGKFYLWAVDEVKELFKEDAALPRRPRVATGGYVYHALNRGVGRSTIFETVGDYAAFEQVLEEAREQVEMRLLSFCVMPNIGTWFRGRGRMAIFRRTCAGSPTPIPAAGTWRTGQWGPGRCTRDASSRFPFRKTNTSSPSAATWNETPCVPTWWLLCSSGVGAAYGTA